MNPDRIMRQSKRPRDIVAVLIRHGFGGLVAHFDSPERKAMRSIPQSGGEIDFAPERPSAKAKICVEFYAEIQKNIKPLPPFHAIEG